MSQKLLDEYSYAIPHVAGVDEAGRGPIAGPVMAAAVILDPDNPITGLKDSKKLSASRREALCVEIQQKSLAWAFGTAAEQEIDEINILQASLLAMQRAIDGLNMTPSKIVVDGIHCPKVAIVMEAKVKGDTYIDVISAASIIAKVTRDKWMLAKDNEYPGYDFFQHKGYPTARHLEILNKLGPCAIHRKTFGPVKKLISETVT